MFIVARVFFVLLVFQPSVNGRFVRIACSRGRNLPRLHSTGVCEAEVLGNLRINPA